MFGQVLKLPLPHPTTPVINKAHLLIFWPCDSEMQKAADTANISVLFFSAGANFWAILGHFWAIFAILGNFRSFLGHFLVLIFLSKIYLCYFYHFFHLWLREMLTHWNCSPMVRYRRNVEREIGLKIYWNSCALRVLNMKEMFRRCRHLTSTSLGWSKTSPGLVRG